VRPAPHARFEDAIETVLAHEGGLSDVKGDPGGLTHWGVSLRFAARHVKRYGRAALLLLDVDGDGDVDADDIRSMPRDGAVKVYRHAFWDAYGYGRLRDQRVATKLFDACVNVGPSRAHVIAQMAANGLGKNLDPDGILGPHSIAEINACDPREFLREFCQEQANFYLVLIDDRPELAIFRKGWMRRASWPLDSMEGAA
jgi:lysozyme family protein